MIVDWTTWGPVLFAGVALPLIGSGLSLREQFKTHERLDEERFKNLDEKLDLIHEQQKITDRDIKHILAKV